MENGFECLYTSSGKFGGPSVNRRRTVSMKSQSLIVSLRRPHSIVRRSERAVAAPRSNVMPERSSARGEPPAAYRSKKILDELALRKPN